MSLLTVSNGLEPTTDRKLSGFIGRYRVWTRSSGFHSAGTEFYWVLPSFFFWAASSSGTLFKNVSHQQPRRHERVSSPFNDFDRRFTKTFFKSRCCRVEKKEVKPFLSVFFLLARACVCVSVCVCQWCYRVSVNRPARLLFSVAGDAAEMPTRVTFERPPRSGAEPHRRRRLGISFPTLAPQTQQKPGNRKQKNAHTHTHTGKIQ